MSRNDRFGRRTFLRTTAGFAGVVAAVPAVNADGAGDSLLQTGTVEPSNFVLEQGGACVPLGVVTSELPVETFYDYRSSDTDPTGWYSSYGPASALEEAGNSVLFLYRGPKGTSLVFMHGKRGGGTGGSVTFHISGLPTDGEWAVTDDQYDAGTNYDAFDESDGEWTVDWTWAADSDHGGGADGGAFRGITSDDTVKIAPAFNDAARLYGRHRDRSYVGEVRNWNALSADSAGYQWRSLDMETPVVIHAGSCGGAATTTTKMTTTTTERTESRTATTESTDTSTQARPTTTTNATFETTSGSGANGQRIQTKPSIGQDGLGVMTALSGLIGTAFYLYRTREE